MRAVLCGFLLFGSVTVAHAGATLPPRQARIHQQICATCHTRPGLGIPLLGDEAAWAPRRARGLDALVETTVRGVGGMPPLGTCSFCTREDLDVLVAYLAGLEVP